MNEHRAAVYNPFHRTILIRAELLRATRRPHGHPSPPTAKTIPSNGSTKIGKGLLARAVAKVSGMPGAGETSHRLQGWAAL